MLTLLVTSIAGYILISTDDTSMVLGNHSERRIDKNRTICKTNLSVGDVLRLSNSYKGHWRLLIFNINNQTLTLLDPYKNNSDKSRAAKNVENFIVNCNENSALYALLNIEWKMKSFGDRPFQSCNDTSKCGLFVIRYLDCLANGNGVKQFKPAIYRQEVDHEILL